MMHGSNGILMLTCINLLKINKFNRHDSEDYWPTSTKDTIQWSTFLTIMERTANITKKGLISSLLKVFAIFELRLSYKEGNLDVVSLRCINCKRETGLFLKNNTFDETFTKFVLNAILHHVGMSWIISSNKEMKYEMDENNHQDWFE